MFKSVSNFTKTLSIKVQLITVMVLCIIGAALFGAFAFLSDMQTKSPSILSKIQSDLNQLDENHLSMRHYETEYYSNPLAKNVAEFQKKSQQSLILIDQILPNVSGKALNDLNFIKQKIQDYRRLFQILVTTQKQLGFSADQGLQGQIDRAVNNIQQQLFSLQLAGNSSTQINRIKVELLTLRRHEKDFMLYFDDAYLDQFNDQVLSFDVALAAATFSAAAKLQISQSLTAYIQKFQQWNQTSLALETALFELDTIFDTFSPVLANLVISYEIRGEQYHQQMISNQKLSRTYLIVSVFIIAILLVAIGIMLLLFRQQQKFKNVVKQRANLLKQTTLLEQMNQKNISLANVDILTALPNRRSFFSQLDALTTTNPNRKLFVGLLDLDGFKRINDVFGHPAGDDLLIKSSQRIQDIVGENTILARLGGDEFGLIITQPADIENISQIGDDICHAMHQAFHLNEGNVQIGATVGFVEYPSMATNSQTLFERADYALCHSKQHSKGQPLIFTAAHQTLIQDGSKIEQQLRTANLEQEMSLMFLPIIHTGASADTTADDTRTVGFEALARWHNPALGKIRPEIFIKAAEQMGVIGELTTILLRKALAAACQWPDDVYLSFNLSVYDLSSPQTVLSLISLIEKSGFPPHRITFEITETAVMDDFNQATESLNLLKLQGVKIALDDFGTGYSSLSYVQKMPLDRLKIDRSFITDITHDQNTQNIVKTIVDLCHNMGLNCIVEGVETAAQLTTLKKMGCHSMQGFYFSRPLSDVDTLKYINQKNRVAESLQA